MSVVFLLLALGAYLAAVSVARSAWLRDRFGRVPWLALGVGAHVASVALDMASEGGFPLDSMRSDLEALALLVVLVLAVLRRRPRMETLGELLTPIVALLLLGALVAPGAERVEPTQTLFFPLHVGLLLLSFTCFALSFALSAMFLVVRRRLKSKRLEGIARLPPLDALDRLNFRSLAAGFVALTAGMGMGGVWAATHPPEHAGPDLTVYVTVAVWIWYAVAIHARLVGGWQGRRSAVFGVVGFGGLVVLTLATALLFRGWHGFGG